MKKSLFQNVILIFTCLLITSSLVAQSPQGIPYQAVMRNPDGSVMANSAVSLTFMIHDGAANGTVVYQESHALTSNAQGLVTCVVGNGVVSEGNFSSINWGNGAKFLHVMMGSDASLLDLGTQQMLSVPYALYAGSTSISVSHTGDTLTVGGQSVIVPGVSAANPPALYTQGIGVTDIDGNFYPSIIINGQEWMQKNLAVSKYQNGDAMPTGLSEESWYNTTNGAYDIYNNDPINNVLYGKLYNWYAVNDSRGLCPTGWHIPSDEEWSILIDYLDTNANGGDSIPNLAGGILKATSGWDSPNLGATNLSGFVGLPAGYSIGGGTYGFIGHSALWWSSTIIGFDNSLVWIRHVYSSFTDVYRYFVDSRGGVGISVRCIRD